MTLTSTLGADYVADALQPSRPPINRCTEYMRASPGDELAEDHLTNVPKRSEHCHIADGLVDFLTVPQVEVLRAICEAVYSTALERNPSTFALGRHHNPSGHVIGYRSIGHRADVHGRASLARGSEQ